jgi:hypothetical protein
VFLKEPASPWRYRRQYDQSPHSQIQDHRYPLTDGAYEIRVAVLAKEGQQRGQQPDRAKDAHIHRQGMKRTLSIIVSVLVASTLLIGSWNYFTLWAPVSAENASTNVKVWVHYQNYVDSSVLDFDIRAIGPGNSRATVFAVFLKDARALKGRSFTRVMLLYQGDTRFMIDGSYFNRLGEELDLQNPLYTIRTFSSYVYRPDGRRAFPERYAAGSGLLKGLSNLSLEFQEFGDFCDQWYANQ